MSYDTSPPYARRQNMQMCAAEERSLLLSEGPSARTKAGSPANNPWYHSIRADGSWDDEYQYTDLMALVVLDDTPHGVCFRNLQHLRAPPKLQHVVQS
jgi:hypothetical protein